MSFHVRSGEVGFFCDDAGDSSKMRLEGRFSGGIFIVFMICGCRMVCYLPRA